MATELKNILDGLNEAQVAAATSDAAAILCIAGAGSGKTQTLAARVAYLVTAKRYSPHNVLVLTFTNKAAREMQERIVDYLTFGVPHVWVLDPRTQRAYLYTSEGSREVKDALHTENPEIVVPLEKAFAESQ